VRSCRTFLRPDYIGPAFDKYNLYFVYRTKSQHLFQDISHENGGVHCCIRVKTSMIQPGRRYSRRSNFVGIGSTLTCCMEALKNSIWDGLEQ
jgi:hypothetical protein